MYNKSFQQQLSSSYYYPEGRRGEGEDIYPSNYRNRNPIGILSIKSYTFHDFVIKKELIEGLLRVGIKNPTKLQIECLPHVLKRKDLICMAPENSGKSIMLIIALIEMIEVDKQERMYHDGDEYGRRYLRDRGVVIPEREGGGRGRRGGGGESFVKCLIVCSESFFCGRIISELSMVDRMCNNYLFCWNVDRVKRGNQIPEIVVGTPKQIKNLIEGGKLYLDKIQFFIINQIDKILSSKEEKNDLQSIYPIHLKQVMIFSDTQILDVDDMKFCKEFVNNPHEYSITENELTLYGIDHYFVELSEEKKYQKLIEIIDLFESYTITIFVRNYSRAMKLNERLNKCCIPSIYIKEEINEKEKERLTSFGGCGYFILVITYKDYSITEIKTQRSNVIINFDLPTSCDDYLNGIGNLGERHGNSILFVVNDNKLSSHVEEQGKDSKALTERELLVEVQNKILTINAEKKILPLPEKISLIFEKQDVDYPTEGTPVEEFVNEDSTENLDNDSNKNYDNLIFSKGYEPVHYVESVNKRNLYHNQYFHRNENNEKELKLKRAFARIKKDFLTSVNVPMNSMLVATKIHDIKVDSKSLERYENECNDSSSIISVFNDHIKVLIDYNVKVLKKKAKDFQEYIDRNKEILIGKVESYKKIHQKIDKERFLLSENSTEFTRILTHCYDVFEIIFKYLNTREKLVCCYCCSFFYKVISDKVPLDLDISFNSFTKNIERIISWKVMTLKLYDMLDIHDLRRRHKQTSFKGMFPGKVLSKETEDIQQLLYNNIRCLKGLNFKIWNKLSSEKITFYHSIFKVLNVSFRNLSSLKVTCNIFKIYRTSPNCSKVEFYRNELFLNLKELGFDIGRFSHNSFSDMINFFKATKNLRKLLMFHSTSSNTDLNENKVYGGGFGFEEEDDNFGHDDIYDDYVDEESDFQRNINRAKLNSLVGLGKSKIFSLSKNYGVLITSIMKIMGLNSLKIPLFFDITIKNNFYEFLLKMKNLTIIRKYFAARPTRKNMMTKKIDREYATFLKMLKNRKDSVKIIFNGFIGRDEFVKLLGIPCVYLKINNIMPFGKSPVDELNILQDKNFIRVSKISISSVAFQSIAKWCFPNYLKLLKIEISTLSEQSRSLTRIHNHLMLVLSTLQKCETCRIIFHSSRILKDRNSDRFCYETLCINLVKALLKLNNVEEIIFQVKRNVKGYNKGATPKNPRIDYYYPNKQRGAKKSTLTEKGRDIYLPPKEKQIKEFLEFLKKGDNTCLKRLVYFNVEWQYEINKVLSRENKDVELLLKRIKQLNPKKKKIFESEILKDLPTITSLEKEIKILKEKLLNQKKLK